MEPRHPKQDLFASSTPFMTGRKYTLIFNGSVKFSGATGLAPSGGPRPISYMAIPGLRVITSLKVIRSEGNLVNEPGEPKHHRAACLGCRMGRWRLMWRRLLWRARAVTTSHDDNHDPTTIQTPNASWTTTEHRTTFDRPNRRAQRTLTPDIGLTDI